MPQSEMGQIVLKYEGVAGLAVADTGVLGSVQDFAVGGQGTEETDSGIIPVSGGNGARMAATDETDHAIGIGTQNAFSPALNGALMFEARVQFNNLDTKEAWVGFSDVPLNTISIQTDIAHVGTGTITNTGSDFCGFILSAEATDDEDWHLIHNGGTAAASSTTAADVDGTTYGAADAVAGEWQVLRVEVDPDGTVRWYIDGVLLNTVVNAASTSVKLGAAVIVESKGTAVEEMDVSYCVFRANRDWTV